MENFISYSIILHVIAGCVALLSGLAAFLLRNKVKKHRPFGKIYFWCMTIIFVTSLYVSFYKEIWFLLFVSVFSYYSCITAFRSLKLKKLHLGQKPKPIDWFIEVMNVLFNLSFIIFGILIIKNNPTFGIICFVFGGIGLFGTYTSIKRFRGSIIHKNYWLIGHIGGMMGSYIGAFTAFLVNNNGRWIHAPEIVAWLGPTVVFVPFIFIETRKYKKAILTPLDKEQ